MLAALALLAATHVTPQYGDVNPSAHTVSVVRHLDAHELHELHLAHLSYLHWQHEQREVRRHAPVVRPAAAVTIRHAAPGVYSCQALQSLWRSAGGNPGSAFIASEIAMAESGGQSWAVSPTDDYGLWQINGSHGALATLDPYGNARAAVIISDNGRSWAPWTTYVSGAYIGRCLRRCRLASTCDAGACLAYRDTSTLPALSSWGQD